ncbi:MAG: DDE-type integrase/transposase/recombinase [Candidatus Buchananbacteria bacterium]|nr:DDE-type integrase/transposase/recombinase [Candidatus Buchananbacteria bacterium]
MQQIYLNHWFRGYNQLMKYISDIAHLKEKDQAVIRERIRILEFFDEFGKVATQKAFNRSRSTIFLWKKIIKKGGGRLSSLKSHSQAPRSRSKRITLFEHVDFIENYRHEHPGVSKETICPELKEYCLKNNLPVISESTIGRIIGELKNKGRLPQHLKLSYYARTGNLVIKHQKKIKKLRRKDYKPTQAGDLMQIDAIELFIDGTKRYIITAIDIYAKFAFAYAYKSLSSASARDFMTKLIRVSPFAITHIQTDNGQEFHKFFAEYVQNQTIIHFYNYPRCPKMNSFIENFNGLIQRQYVDWHYQELKDDVDSFNIDLMEYLLWYNTKKQHSAIGKIPPLRYYVNTIINKLNLSPILTTQKSNILWTSASSCVSRQSGVKLI